MNFILLNYTCISILLNARGENLINTSSKACLCVTHHITLQNLSPLIGKHIFGGVLFERGEY